jgi:hypothetical protein
MSEIQVRRDGTNVRRHIDVGRARTLRGRLLGALAVIGLAGLALCASASANLRSDLQEKFSECPYNNPLVTGCLYSPTTSGEFIVGNGTVPITKPVILQAGTTGMTGELIPPESGNELSKTALPIPGGLVGIELPGDFTEVTATAELAGTASYTNKINLPLKVKLDNPLNVLLGSGCYIGSEAEPLELHLGAETTNPPPPNKPITGSARISSIDGAIRVIEQTFVDNAFAAPGANGCTPLPPVGDLAVNTKEGLPAAAGKNTAIMTGFTYDANALVVKAVLKLPELGRCVQSPTHSGEFFDSACLAETDRAPEGKYEWLPGPGPANKFKGASTTMTLETVGHTKITCPASSSEGEYTGPKTQTVSLRLTGCHTGSRATLKSCQSSGAGAGEIQTSTLAGSLDFIKENVMPTLPVLGVDLKPVSGTELAAIECGGSPQALSGSVIAPITAIDKMKTSFKEKPTATGGIQAPEAFEEQSKDTLSLGGEQAGLKGSITQTNEEALEIKGIR